MQTTAFFSHNAKRTALIAFFLALSLITFHFLLAPSVHAQSCTGGNINTKEAIDRINKCSIEKDIFDDKVFNLNQITGTTDSLYNLLTGRSQLHPETNRITQNSGGAIGASGKMVALLYSAPPASGVNYFAQKLQRFNLVQPAYAQTGGIGFEALAPVQKIWSVFRNASYIAFVLIFIIIGFMVMFRAHISPQAVATVQDSIPRLVIALALVTFSYAIAGFMIDLMFLFLNITINLLQSTGLLGTGGDKVFAKSVFGLSFSVWDDLVGSVASAIANLIQSIIDIDVLDDILGFFGGGLAGIIAGIAILFVMFRVFIMLLMAYIQIIVLTMFAPFFFLIQALPGNNGAKEWFKQIGSNISVFPTVALMFIFAGMLGGLEALGGSGQSQFSAQQIGQFPLLAGDIDINTVGKLIGLGFLLLTPEAANLVKNFIGSKGPNLGGAAGATMGAAAGAIARPVTAPVRSVGEAMRWRQSNAIAGRLLGGRTSPTPTTTAPDAEPPPHMRH